MSKKSTRVAEKESKKATVKSDTQGDFGLNWKTVNSTLLVLDSAELKGSSKIASFDMDHTIVKPKGKGKFPASRDDWEWMFPQVPTKLKELHESGFKIVIFTNQGGIEKNKQNKGDITGKILDISASLGFPIQAFASAAENHYRKPFTTMWDIFVDEHNGGVVVDTKASFYCGDAAGRKAEWKKGYKKDFSASDRQFAWNCNVPFTTPEFTFLEEPETDKWDWVSFDPSTTLNTKLGCDTMEDNADRVPSLILSFINMIEPYKTSDLISSEKEMVIMVGKPASGKSTFTTKHFIPNGYVRVNRDTLGTAAKCKKAVEAAISEGKSVVIDNTNGSKDTRAEYIKIAKANQLKVRCFYFETSLELANHLNFVRVKQTDGAVRRIPPVAYHTFNKKFEEPDESEGIDEVKTIEFVPDLSDANHKKVFLCYNPDF